MCKHRKTIQNHTKPMLSELLKACHSSGIGGKDRLAKGLNDWDSSDSSRLSNNADRIVQCISVYMIWDDLSKAPQIGQRSHHWRCADVASLAISSCRGTANSAAASTAFSASKTWKKRLNNWKKLIEKYWKHNFIEYSTMSWRGG